MAPRVADPIEYSTEGVYTFARTGEYSLAVEDRPVHAEGWRTEVHTGERSNLAFSLLPIRVRFAGQDPTLLSPSVAAFTAPMGAYHRYPISRQGQRTIFMSIPHRTWERPGFEHALDGAPPIPRIHAPSSPRAFALARQLVRYVHDPSARAEPLVLEETCARIIDLSLDAASESPGARIGATPEGRTRQRELVNAVQARLHEDAGRPWSLAELADDVELSPAYLSRLFRAHTGMTITRALTIERIAHALERLPQQRGNLARVALASGFGSHARMTQIFTALLGVTPSAIARQGPGATARTIDRLRNPA